MFWGCAAWLQMNFGHNQKTFERVGQTSITCICLWVNQI